MCIRLTERIWLSWVFIYSLSILIMLLVDEFVKINLNKVIIVFAFVLNVNIVLFFIWLCRRSYINDSVLKYAQIYEDYGQL